MKPFLIIAGPTCSGKNRVAIEIAKHYPVEIVNADSRQIYRDLIIGTNQPSPEELRGAPHHLFAFVDPKDSFSGADYEKLAVPIIHQIQSRANLAVVVGGTGFYIKALLRGVWPVAPKNAELRNRLQQTSKRRNPHFLHRMLQRLDPASSSQIAANDEYRIMRSLEIFFQSGIRRSELPSRQTERFRALKYYLSPDRETLQDCIRERTKHMFDAGWVEEVRSLLERYPGFENAPSAKSLGYQEILAYLRGDSTVETCIERIQLRTMQYAKRQLTWFRNQDGFQPLPSVEELRKIIETVLQ